MIYSIIFTRYSQSEGLISWIDSNEWDTEKKAYEHAAKMLQEWIDEDPTIEFTVYKHAMIWKAQARYDYDED